MTTYQVTGKSYENDGKIYEIVKEFDDNDTPDDTGDDTFVQQISKVEVGVIADLRVENIVAKGKVLLARIQTLEGKVTALEGYHT